jgi:U3 small nucleolar RNA-associated protein 10
MLKQCLVEYGQAAVQSKDDTLLKALNQQLLQATRERKESIRLNALKSLTSLYGRIGDELLQHLPETVPYLSELLEDSSELVEAENRRLIKVIESHLGESLQDHLR